MAGPKATILLAVVAFAQAASIPKPKPGSNYMGPPGAGAGGPGNLGVIIPGAMGWGGWTPTTTPAPGWPAETTTPGWSVVPTTGWPGWSVETTTTPGWVAPPPPPTGWPAPLPAVAPVDITMLGEAVVLGAGEAGATHGSSLSVAGDGWTPAVASFSSGSYSSLGQGAGVLQISNIGADGESNTFHGIDSYNFGDAGEYLGGNALGTQVDIVGGGGSYVVGEGAIEQGGLTTNTNAATGGWKKED